jgi:hypothetical protein
MSETLTAEPKAKKTNPFDGLKKEPEMIVFKLLKENPTVKGREDTPLFPPLISLKNTDIIKWKDGERAIRYLHGWQSIFVDEQEANGRVVPENVLANPLNRLEIIDGEIRVRPSENTKLKFLEMCNKNANSEYRTGKVAAIFARFSEDTNASSLKEKQNLQKKAFDKAFAADPQYVFDNAPKLSIPLNAQTGEGRSFDAVFADFKQYALNYPEKFLEVCSN